MMMGPGIGTGNEYVERATNNKLNREQRSTENERTGEESREQIGESSS